MRWCLILLLATLASAVVNNGPTENNDGPPGLVEIQHADDLIAEASDTDTQKREIPVGGLSNSYGEPIPADSYGPPNQDHHQQQPLGPQPIPISDSYGPPSKPNIGLPVPIYGVPLDSSNSIKYPGPPPDIPPPLALPQEGPVFNHPQPNYGPPIIPHANYGPPKQSFGGSVFPVNLGPPKIQYHGPPPPQYGPPKLQYGPPKLQYGPPKPQYGPPKIQYSIPKPQYGPPKLQYKPQFSAPKPQYGPPKIQYGPPKLQYGPPKPIYGPPKQQQFIPPKLNFVSSLKPHPVYGPPIALQQSLKPQIQIPHDNYGPPSKPISLEFSQQLSAPEQIYGPPIGIQHGPPEPDPNPRPAHPGIPAPPTPPHILYDGWTPMPGLVSKPPSHHQDFLGPPPPLLHSEGSLISSISNSYGVPTGAESGFVSSGYSSVAGNEALQGIDLNSIIGGSAHGADGLGVQGSKTVFEAHYTEGLDSNGGVSTIPTGSFGISSSGHGDSSLSVVESVGFDLGTTHLGPRQLGSFSSVGVGLKPPSGIYGVPPGGKYGVPPPMPPHNKPVSHLSLSYGVPSGSVGSGSIHVFGGNPPKQPISFREPVPQGLLETIGQSVVHKDVFGIEGQGQNGIYLPPPVQDISNSIRSNGGLIDSFAHGSDSSISIQSSIEPSNLYSLPSRSSPVNFVTGNNYHGISSDSFGSHSEENPIITNLDGSRIEVVKSNESTAAAAAAVADSEVAGSSKNEVIGTDAASLAAAILKNCPYHKALYEAAKSVEHNNPSALASSYIASLTSLDSKLNISGKSNFGVSANKDQVVSASNVITSEDKGKSLRGEDAYKYDAQRQQFQALPLQSPPVTFQHGVHQIPVQGQFGSYTLQIQSADGIGPSNGGPSEVVPHEQVLSEGLLQSILQAIEQPHQTQIVPDQPQIVQLSQNGLLDLSQAGISLPEGFELVTQTENNSYKVVEEEEDDKPAQEKEKLPIRGDQKAEDEHKSVIVVSPSKPDRYVSRFASEQTSEKSPAIVTPLSIIDDNEIAVYFNGNNNEVDNEDNEVNPRNRDAEETSETVTEISVESSVSASEEEEKQQQDGEEAGGFGEKIVKKQS